MLLLLLASMLTPGPQATFWDRLALHTALAAYDLGTTEVAFSLRDDIHEVNSHGQTFQGRLKLQGIYVVLGVGAEYLMRWIRPGSERWIRRVAIVLKLGAGTQNLAVSVRWEW